MNLVNQQMISDIKSLISVAKENAIRKVDFERTLMYWHIGKRIFEEEQQGKDRAEYGTYIIKYLRTTFTGIWQWVWYKTIVKIQTILPDISNCVRSADAIKLDSIQNVIKR